MSSQDELSSHPERIGPYFIHRKLGQGGMSDVYEGYDESGRRKVAVKLLSESLIRDMDALARIEREIAILKAIHHTHVAQWLDYGQTPEGRPYIVFELVKGPTLAEIIQRRDWPDHQTGLKWMSQAAEALDEAWKQHIIHRDLKPANMMIDAEAGLKIVDFGMAKALHDPNHASRKRIILGTPRYISPEMGLGQSLDFRADMYSLGATFYHLFVRQAPFDAPTPLELVQKHTSATLPPPHSIDPELPHDICDILTRLLEKDPSRRYQSYDDLISDLREAGLALRTRSNPSDTLVEGQETRASVSQSNSPANSPDPQNPTWNFLPSAGTAILSVVILIILLLLIWGAIAKN